MSSPSHSLLTISWAEFQLSYGSRRKRKPGKSWTKKRHEPNSVIQESTRSCERGLIFARRSWTQQEIFLLISWYYRLTATPVGSTCYSVARPREFSNSQRVLSWLLNKTK